MSLRPVSYTHLDVYKRQAQMYADAANAALTDLPDNDYTAALRGLAHYAVNRDH